VRETIDSKGVERSRPLASHTIAGLILHTGRPEIA
jgi:hypothetical protein